LSSQSDTKSIVQAQHTLSEQRRLIKTDTTERFTTAHGAEPQSCRRFLLQRCWSRRKLPVGENSLSEKTHCRRKLTVGENSLSEKTPEKLTGLAKLPPIPNRPIESEKLWKFGSIFYFVKIEEGV